MGIPITDPVKLAWCAFARDYEEKWREIPSGEQGLSIASFEAGAAWERARAAEREQKLREKLLALVLACDHNQGDYNKALADARDLTKEE